MISGISCETALRKLEGVCAEVRHIYEYSISAAEAQIKEEQAARCFELGMHVISGVSFPGGYGTPRVRLHPTVVT